MGGRALLDGIVHNPVATVRSGGKSGNRHLLWRLDLRRVCNATSDVIMGASAASSRLCDGVHSLSARQKRLSNVGPASTRSGAWLGCQREQRFQKKEAEPVAACPCCCANLRFFASRPICESGGTTTSNGDLHPQTCGSTSLGGAWTHTQR